MFHIASSWAEICWTWRCTKQNVVARSSAKAEFRVMAHGVCELLWLKIILNTLKVTREESIVGLINLVDMHKLK